MVMKTIMRYNNMKEIIYIILAAVLLAGCQKEDFNDPSSVGSLIYLSATTENSTPITRTPYEYTVPNDQPDGILNTAIWASSFYSAQNGYTYPNPNPPLNGKNGTGANANQVAIHATAHFDSGSPQLLDQAVYPQSGTPVFFVGLHPNSNWSSDAEGKTANFKFNGSQDVMFAPRIEGQYADESTLNNPVFDVPELNFRHLLTWMKIKVVAESQNAMSAWGKIKDIKITSQNQLSVDINRGDIANGVFDFKKQVSYSASADHSGYLPLYKTGTNNVFPDAGGYQLKYYPEVTAPQEVAYVLCSPVDALETVVEDGVDVKYPEYTILIETENRKVSVPIDLKINETTYFTSNTRAKCFTLNLTFKMGNTIVVTGDIVDWTLGGVGNVEL